MPLEAPPIRSDGLQIADNRRFQRRFWKVERVAWVFFAAVVVAGLAGLTGGGGYFSRQQVQLSEAIVDLPRVSRWEDSDHILLTFTSDAPTYTIRLGGGFNGAFSIDQVQPQPARSRAVPGGLEMEFSGVGSGGTARIGIMPSAPGLATLSLGVGGNETSVRVLVLP